MTETSRQPETNSPGVVANERLTALTGGLLVGLLAVMGITVLNVQELLPQHFFLGFLLIPPLALKITTTGYRFVRYYTGDPAYRQAGPPQLLMRLIAPIVVLSTAAVFVTGLELWLFGLRFGSDWVDAHKVSFLVWLPATAAHLLGHLGATGRAAVGEVTSSGRDALSRRSLVVGSLITGAAVAVATLAFHSPYTYFGGGG